MLAQAPVGDRSASMVGPDPRPEGDQAVEVPERGGVPAVVRVISRQPVVKADRPGSVGQGRAGLVQTRLIGDGERTHLPAVAELERGRPGRDRREPGRIVGDGLVEGPGRDLAAADDDQRSTVRGEEQAIDRPAMIPEGSDRASGDGVPAADQAVAAPGRDHRAVRAEGRRDRRAGMRHRRPDGRPRGNVPDLRRRLAQTDQSPRIRAEGEAPVVVPETGPEGLGVPEVHDMRARDSTEPTGSSCPG